MNKEFSKSFRLHTTLMARILLGEYRNGDSLPAATQLSDEFGVSVATVKRVFDVLAECKLIRRRNGRSPVVMNKSNYGSEVRTQLRVVVIRDNTQGGLYFGYRYAPWMWTLQEMIYARLMRDHIPVVTIGKDDLDSMKELLFPSAGIIYATSAGYQDVIDRIKALEVPYVVVAGYNENPQENMVCYNYQPASERMAVYLLGCGVKHVDIIGNPRLDGRMDWLLNMLYKHGFAEGSNLDCFAVWHIYDEQSLEEHYIGKLPPERLPLGVVCYNDYHASVVNKLLQKQGYRAKQDFVVLSLGDLLEPADGGYCTLEIEQLAEKGVDMLYRRMVNLQDEPCCRVEPVFVIDRKKSKRK